MDTTIYWLSVVFGIVVLVLIVLYQIVRVDIELTLNDKKLVSFKNHTETESEE